ncbi:MAG: WD40 repeat domain-containing protein [Methylobacter sp.]|nr:WD40 repeat domain-containing protein [Methylobacter sp.]
MKHTGPISSVATHGAYIATGGYDNRVILWDSLTRKSLARGMHDHLVNHCAFSPDGKLLVSAGSDYTARIWELPTLRLLAVLTGHADDVDMAVFAPDNCAVATCALDRAVRVFDLSGRCLKTFWGHTGNIISLLWSRDGKRLVSSSVDGTVREWDIEKGIQLHCYNLDGVRTDTIEMDVQGRIIAGDDLGRIAIITTEGKLCYYSAHRAGIKKIVYCEQRRLLASLSYDRTLALWHISETGTVTEQQRTEIPAIIWPRAAAMLDNDKLVAGTFGTTYAVYDWRQNSWNTDEIEAGNGINAVVVHQGSTYAVGDSGTVFKDGKAYSHLGSLCNFLLSAGDRLYAGGQLGQLFDVDSGKIIYEHHSPLNCGALFYRAAHPHIAVGSYTGEMIVFSVQPDQTIKPEQKIKVYENAIKGIAANQDRLFSVCASTDIAWHNCDDLSLALKITQAHEKIANACCKVGDTGFASVARDRSLRIWIDGGQEVYPAPHLNSIKCICASPDGQSLMTGSYGGTLAGFDFPTRTWTTFERPTTAGISSISYDPVQSRFLAASYDGEIYPVAH